MFNKPLILIDNNWAKLKVIVQYCFFPTNANGSNEDCGDWRHTVMLFMYHWLTSNIWTTNMGKLPVLHWNSWCFGGLIEPWHDHRRDGNDDVRLHRFRRIPLMTYWPLSTFMDYQFCSQYTQGSLKSGQMNTASYEQMIFNCVNYHMYTINLPLSWSSQSSLF